MTTASLELSKKIYEIVGSYETENYWVNGSIEYGYEGEHEIRRDGVWTLWYWGKPTYQDVVHTEEFYSFNSVGKRDEWSKLIQKEDQERKDYLQAFPSHSFAELVRILPKIGGKKGFPEGLDARVQACRITILYQDALTEPEGMQAVESYLEKIL